MSDPIQNRHQDDATARAWFGSQLGSTLWLPLAAADWWREDAVSGAVSLTGFIASNAWGIWLWTSRSNRSARIAYQMLVVGLAITCGLVMLTVNHRANDQVLPYWVLLIFPVLMVRLWFVKKPREAGQRVSTADEAEPRS